MIKKEVFRYNSISIKYYLLGIDNNGITYWLPEPTWAGYSWDFYRIRCRIKSNGYDTYDAQDFYPTLWGEENSILSDTTFNRDEGWDLVELLYRFYLFRKVVDIFTFDQGLTLATPISMKDKIKAEEINEQILPPIMNKIISILTP